MSEIDDPLPCGTVIDPFFQVVHDGQWNACIGEQGEELNYVEGDDLRRAVDVGDWNQAASG